MRFEKKMFKTILGICAVGAIGIGICQEYALKKENKFTNVVTESEKENTENTKNTISYNDLVKYEVVEIKSGNDENKLHIARPNNFNSDKYKIYYDIFTNEDIIRESEDKLVTTTPIEYYLYDSSAIQEEYSQEDLERLLKNISQNYDYTEAKILTKENN